VSARRFREWLAYRIAPWTFVPYREEREEAFRWLAGIAYGSPDAAWTSPRVLAESAVRYSRMDARRTPDERGAVISDVEALDSREDS
jgi:hypothetical protein